MNTLVFTSQHIFHISNIFQHLRDGLWEVTDQLQWSLPSGRSHEIMISALKYGHWSSWGTWTPDTRSSFTGNSAVVAVPASTSILCTAANVLSQMADVLLTSFRVLFRISFQVHVPAKISSRQSGLFHHASQNSSSPYPLPNPNTTSTLSGVCSVAPHF